MWTNQGRFWAKTVACTAKGPAEKRLSVLALTQPPVFPQTSMKNMEKELLCPVCQEMYKQPLVLPCTHNVCQACAREVLGQQGYLGHGGDPSSEPTSPASTPSTRSPRLSRRTLPKPDRLDRLLKSGGAGVCGMGWECRKMGEGRCICSGVELLTAYLDS